MAAYASRVTDMFSRAYPNFSIDYQLSFAVDHFISRIANTSSRDYLMRERARRPLERQEAVRIAQGSETARLSDRCTRTQPLCCLERVQTPVARPRVLLQSIQAHVAMRVIGRKRTCTPHAAGNKALIAIPKTSRDLCPTRVVELA